MGKKKCRKMICQQNNVDMILRKHCNIFNLETTYSLVTDKRPVLGAKTYVIN